MAKNYRDRIEYFRQRWKYQKFLKTKFSKDESEIDQENSFMKYCEGKGKKYFREFKEVGAQILASGLKNTYELDNLSKKIYALITNYYQRNNLEIDPKKKSSLSSPKRSDDSFGSLSLVKYLTLNREGAIYWAELRNSLAKIINQAISLARITYLLNLTFKIPASFLRYAE